MLFNRFHPVGPLSLLWISWFLAGCWPSSGVPDSPKGDPHYVNQGIITATASRFLDSSGSEPFEQFEVMAMFPRYRNNRQRLVDSLLGTHVPQSDLSLDTCSRPEPLLKSRDKKTFTESTQITLMDAGYMHLEYSDKRRAIPTRTFPDLLKVIDGVIYSVNEQRGADFIPEQTYTIKTAGTDDVGKFEAVLDAPNDLGEVRLNGISPSEQMPSIAPGQDLALSWEGEGYGDEVITRIDWTNMGLSWSITCRMKDDGSFIIPGDITKDIRIELTENDHDMSLSRVRQVSFRARGLSYGDFSFVASTNFLIRLEGNN